MKIRLILLFCLLSLTSQYSYAIKVSGLYQAAVPVNDESTSLRNSALKQALIEVLIKLTGDRNINSSSSAEAITDKPERFVQQFRYRQVTYKDGETGPPFELLVKFDEVALNDTMRNYGLTVWGRERPAILVWMAHEGAEGRQMVSFEDSPEYLDIMDKRASARGLSLLFPLLDLEDTAHMNVSDVWGGFKDPIIEASKRYQADVVLTAKLVQILPTLWESRWTAYIEGQSLSWTTQDEVVDMVLDEGIDELADRLASRYANSGSTQAEVIQLQVSDINNLDEYARTLSYLESLQSVSSVQVKHVFSDKVLFEIISHGGQTVISQAINLGKTLEPVSNGENMNYRLLPR